MTLRADASLSRLTTLRLGGPARRLVAVDSADAIVEAMREVDPEGGPTMLLAGGSNVVVADDGFDGTVVHVTSRGITHEDAGDGTVHVRVAAGEPWDDLVAHCVAEGLAGVECLSGIPGSTGATPIQNVGAYGQDVAETIVAVRAYDRVARTVVDLPAADCAFTYRHSRFKGDDRHALLEVTFALRRDPQGGIARYAELARTLDVEPGARVPLTEARAAVLGLRARKGMVLDAADHDTWSAGSFFTNPVLDAAGFAGLLARAGEGLVPPRYDEPDGRVKTSAAWLIERAGFGKGHPGPGGRVSLSTKHTLALTNRGGGTTEDLLALAREIRDGVQDRFGVTLVNEPVLVGVTL